MHLLLSPCESQLAVVWWPACYKKMYEIPRACRPVPTLLGVPFTVCLGWSLPKRAAEIFVTTPTVSVAASTYLSACSHHRHTCRPILVYHRGKWAFTRLAVPQCRLSGARQRRSPFDPTSQDGSGVLALELELLSLVATLLPSSSSMSLPKLPSERLSLSLSSAGMYSRSE